MNIIISTSSAPIDFEHLKFENLDFNRYNISQNVINFYEEYKDNLKNVFDDLYIKINELTKTNPDTQLFEKIKNEPIKVDKYNLICETIKTNIIIRNCEKKNCFIQYDCEKEIKIKDEELEVDGTIFVYNFQLALLLLSTNKYLFSYKGEEKEYFEEDRDFDEISIISDVDSLAFNIKKNKIIHSTNKDIYYIERIFENFDNRHKAISDTIFFPNLINSYNFPRTKKIEYLNLNINLDNKLASSKNGNFIYNKEMGLTQNILDYFHAQKVLGGFRKNYFYININLLENAKTNEYKRFFILYYLASLFNDSNLFRNFYAKISDLFYKKIEYHELLFKIIEQFDEFNKENKINDNFYFIFDNIYEKNIFEQLKKAQKQFQKNSNFHFYYFIQLNRSTVDLIFTTGFYFINNENNIKPYIEIEYFRKKDINKYIYKIKTDIDNISFLNDIDKFNLFLKAKYISLTNSYYLEKDIANFLKNFSDFFNIYCDNKEENIIIKNIVFINDIVKKCFNDKFNSFLCNYINNNKLGIFDEMINNAIEGILLEKDIILYLIYSQFSQQIKIDKINCFNEEIKMPNFDSKDNILFVQKQDNSPLYDIGIIIHIDGKTILKIYQIGINKDQSQLNKLDRDIISFDLIYFICKLKDKYEFEIDELYFGIITTIEGYNKNFINKIEDVEMDNIDKNNIVINGENLDKNYKNYIKMKNHCEINYFEFLVFDKKNQKFYVHDNMDKLTPINFSSYRKTNFLININTYTFQSVLSIKKMNVNKKDDLIVEIKNLIGKYNILKILGKFETDNYDFYEIQGNNLYIFWKDLNKRYICFYNNGNIFSFSSNQRKISFRANYYIVGLIENDIESYKRFLIATCYKNQDNNI